MKSTTMLMKSIKWTNQKRHQSHKSLKHTLRISKQDVKKYFEWNEDLSHLNLISLNGNITKLNSKDGQEIYDSVLAKIQNDENHYNNKQTNNQVNISKEKLKKNDLKRKIKKYMIDLNEDAWKKIDSNSFLEIEEYIKIIEASDLKRQKQKISQLQEYINLHNKYDVKNIKAKKKNSNATEMVEVFFKFPNHNEISEVSSEEYINTIENYFKSYFKDYEIFFTVFHGDEKLEDKKYGEHPHIFLNARNSKTGEYDFAKRQTELVNSYLKNKNKSLSQENQHKLFPNKLDYTQMKALGEIWQEIFYGYVNKNLLAKKGIQAEVKEKTEEEKALREQIRKDAHKPKEEREFNLYKQALEEKKYLQSHNKELTAVNKNLKSTNENTKAVITKVRAEKKELSRENQKLSIENKHLKKENSIIKVSDRTEKEVVSELFKKNITWLKKDYEGLQKDMLLFSTEMKRFHSQEHIKEVMKKNTDSETIEKLELQNTHLNNDIELFKNKKDYAESLNKIKLDKEVKKLKASSKIDEQTIEKQNTKLLAKDIELDKAYAYQNKILSEGKSAIMELVKTVPIKLLRRLFPSFFKDSGGIPALEPKEIKKEEQQEKTHHHRTSQSTYEDFSIGM